MSIVELLTYLIVILYINT